jgi:hypothetical protein
MNPSPTPALTYVPLTTVTFPEIALRTRDAHKLRGYFGNLFRQHSPLLHNHLDADNGDTDEGNVPKFRYAYPLVQYKVLGNVPTLVGAGEGAALLAQLFLQIRDITLDTTDDSPQTYPVLSKHIRHEQVPLGLSNDLLDYHFQTRWMPLNQTNHRDYRSYTPDEQQAQLKRVLTSQILGLFRTFGLWLQPHERVLVRPTLQQHTTQFKNQTMLAFSGHFTANVIIPNGLGLGKAVSRGFGSLVYNAERRPER